MLSISNSVGQAGKSILDAIVRLLSAFRINPNVITFLGFLISCGVATAFAFGAFRTAGVVLICAGLFDILDGAVARSSRTESGFGAFFDSVLDRYSDIAIYLGLVVYYIRLDDSFYIVLTCIVLMGSVMISYTRARAESLIRQCRVGFLERPERLVLLIIGALAHRIEAVLWVMAVLSHWTVIGRIYYTWSELRRNGDS
jgi:CDP-diacylglycerol---glycerol-3-phosphate 3-phosphatidyltransferase